ncbi:MAG: uL22 family ribosomal protein [Candidatus Micrarchaeia archaeon]
MKYSFNIQKEGIVLAQRYDIDASYKDMGAVCDAIRYLKANYALSLIDDIINKGRPIPYRKHNKGMGSRSELGGMKGAYPIKAAKEVRRVLVNAIANANSRGMPGEEMYVVHALANKTRIERRQPSRGTIAYGRGMYGRSALAYSDLEYAKVEIGLADGSEKWLTHNMKYFIRKLNAKREAEEEKAIEGKPRKGKATQTKPAKSEPQNVAKNAEGATAQHAEKVVK